MQDEDIDILTWNYEKATIPQLKSVLAKEGVTLPTQRANKAEYVKRFLELRGQREEENKKRKRGKATEDTTSTKKKKDAVSEKVSTGKRKTTDNTESTQASKKKKNDESETAVVRKEPKSEIKRRPQNPFQSDEEDEPKLKKKITNKPKLQSTAESTPTSSTPDPVKKIQLMFPKAQSVPANATMSRIPPATAQQAPSVTPIRHSPIASSDGSPTSSTPLEATKKKPQVAQESPISTPPQTKPQIPMKPPPQIKSSTQQATKPSTQMRPPPQQAAKHSPQNQHRATRPVSKPSSKDTIFKVILVVLVIAALGAGAFYVYKTYFQLLPFCDSLPGLSGKRNETCIPCPLHGSCKEGKLTCQAGYVQYGAECIPDEEVENAVHKMTVAAKQALAEQHGRFKCYTSDHKGLTPRELQEALKQKQFIKSELFDVAWAKTAKILKDYLKGLEYQSEEYTLSTICWIHTTASEYKFHLAGVTALIALITWLLRMRRLQKFENQWAHRLVDEVRKMLQQQKHSATHHDRVEPYIAVTHIRDTLLKPPIDKKKRDRIWKRIVEMDTRISKVELCIYGEQQEVWEWQAPIPPNLTPVGPMVRSSVVDEGSSSAIAQRNPGLFAPRTFQT